MCWTSWSDVNPSSHVHSNVWEGQPLRKVKSMVVDSPPFCGWCVRTPGVFPSVHCCAVRVDIICLIPVRFLSSRFLGRFLPAHHGWCALRSPTKIELGRGAKVEFISLVTFSELPGE